VVETRWRCPLARREKGHIQHLYSCKVVLKKGKGRFAAHMLCVHDPLNGKEGKPFLRCFLQIACKEREKKKKKGVAQL